MIDNFALALTHFLLAVALWRVLLRPELDREDAEPPLPLAGGAGGGPETSSPRRPTPNPSRQREGDRRRDG